MWKITSGLFLGWSLGANDSANIFGTGVTTGAVKYRTAVLLTGLFVLSGAILEGPKCMKTVGGLSRLLPLEAFGCTLAAALTMGVLTYFAIPASSSQCIIGAIIGAGLFLGSADFSGLYKIVSCWLFTPISGILAGYLLQRGLGYVLDWTVNSISYRNFFYSTGSIIAGCYGAYSLGSNNVANVTGVYVGSGMLTAETASLIGGLSIVAGVVTYSKRVMMTVGRGIAPLDPFSALVTVLATAFTLHLFTQIKVPVSSSQAIVGAVVGVGLVGHLRTISYRMLARITIGWLLTPVAAGFMAYILLRWVIQ
jgi:PiT family inorganic phosphate transporter